MWSSDDGSEGPQTNEVLVVNVCEHSWPCWRLLQQIPADPFVLLSEPTASVDTLTHFTSGDVTFINPLCASRDAGQKKEIRSQARDDEDKESVELVGPET